MLMQLLKTGIVAQMLSSFQILGNVIILNKLPFTTLVRWLWWLRRDKVAREVILLIDRFKVHQHMVLIANLWRRLWWRHHLSICLVGYFVMRLMMIDDVLGLHCSWWMRMVLYHLFLIELCGHSLIVSSHGDVEHTHHSKHRSCSNETAVVWLVGVWELFLAINLGRPLLLAITAAWWLGW